MLLSCSSPWNFIFSSQLWSVFRDNSHGRWRSFATVSCVTPFREAWSFLITFMFALSKSVHVEGCVTWWAAAEHEPSMRDRQRERQVLQQELHQHKNVKKVNDTGKRKKCKNVWYVNVATAWHTFPRSISNICWRRRQASPALINHHERPEKQWWNRTGWCSFILFNVWLN